MGSTDNLQEDCMLFHGDLTKLRRQRESLMSKKAISKTATLNMQHAFFIFLLWFVEASSQWYFVWKTHRIWSKKHTDPVNTAHVLLACVASVSSRGSSRKLGFFCFRSNFGAITRLETLATQANVLPAQSVYTKHGAIQILFTGLRTTICPRQWLEWLRI